MCAQSCAAGTELTEGAFAIVTKAGRVKSATCPKKIAKCQTVMSMALASKALVSVDLDGREETAIKVGEGDLLGSSCVWADFLPE